MRERCKFCNVVAIVATYNGNRNCSTKFSEGTCVIGLLLVDDKFGLASYDFYPMNSNKHAKPHTVPDW